LKYNFINSKEINASGGPGNIGTKHPIKLITKHKIATINIKMSMFYLTTTVDPGLKHSGMTKERKKTAFIIF